MANHHEEGFIPPIITNDDLRIAPAKASVKKARASESNVVWAVVALLGVTGIFYALKVARQPMTVATDPAPVVVKQDAPAERPVARPRSQRQPYTHPPRFRDTTPAQAETVATLPAAEKVATVGEAAQRKAVDPLEGFDTGAAFDNPPSPGRYGQRTSGLLERMPATNNRGTSNRPNVPDPSFRPRR